MDLEVVQRRALQMGRREAILRLQDAIVSGGDNVGAEFFPVKHHFAPGCYGREMTLPKDSVVVGKIHKHAHLNVISQGHVLVFTEHEGIVELKAPCTFVSTPGTKRVVYAVEETVWTTSHVTDSTDLAEIEREVIAQDFLEVQHDVGICGGSGHLDCNGAVFIE